MKRLVVFLKDVQFDGVTTLKDTAWVLCDACYDFKDAEYLKHLDAGTYEITGYQGTMECNRCHRPEKVTEPEQKPIKHTRHFNTREQLIPGADQIIATRDDYMEIGVLVEDRTYDLNKRPQDRVTESFFRLLSLHRIGDVHVGICDNLISTARNMGLLHTGFTEESYVVTIPDNDQGRMLVQNAGIEITEDPDGDYFGLASDHIFFGSGNVRMFLIEGGSMDNTSDKPYEEMTYEVFEIHLQFE